MTNSTNNDCYVNIVVIVILLRSNKHPLLLLLCQIIMKTITLLLWHFSCDFFMLVRKLHLYSIGICLHSHKCFVDHASPPKKVMNTHSFYYNISLHFEIIARHTIENFPPTFPNFECMFNYISARRVSEIKLLTRILKFTPTSGVPVIKLLKIVQYIGPLIRSHVPRLMGKSRVNQIIFSCS